MGSYSFETNHSYTPGQPLNIYRTCIRNLSKDGDLFINWYIPGPRKVYVLPGELQVFPRRSLDPDARPLNGCLEYGNSGDLTVAEFLGDKDDEARSNSEKESKCKEYVGLDIRKVDLKIEVPVESSTLQWSDKVGINIPSDPLEPRDSMLRLEAEYGVSYNTEKSAHEAYFYYSANRIEGREKGDPNAVSYVARALEGSAIDLLYREFVSKEVVPLGEKGGFTLPLPVAKVYQPADVIIEFSAGTERETVGTLQVTFMQPAG